ncbi:MAG: phytoene/squalene synthase family protein [Bdellovibrionales bacterium]|nr:phytoene/squalene synthase family protein [Bdellovibrionales bacterium]
MRLFLEVSSSAFSATAVSPQKEIPQMAEVSEILRSHAKTFSFAGIFLPRAALRKAEVVYAFCRWVDDVADESSSSTQAAQTLDLISSELVGKTEARAFIREFRRTMAAMNLDAQIPGLLIRGVMSDLGVVDLKSEAELHRYCYLVASTVGLMMCSVLNVSDPRALPFAIDLGLAMQLTNIARDVQEDKTKGRNYLPSGMSAIDVLNEADRFYESAFDGLGYIPWRARFAICVAAVVYRGIGDRIRASDFDPKRERASVSLGRKMFLVLTRAFPLFVRTVLLKGKRHRAFLHRHLQGYPGVDLF